MCNDSKKDRAGKSEFTQLLESVEKNADPTCVDSELEPLLDVVLRAGPAGRELYRNQIATRFGIRFSTVEELLRKRERKTSHWNPVRAGRPKAKIDVGYSQEPYRQF